MIKILTPLSRFEEIEPLVELGADNFFLGFCSSGNIADTNCLNLRPFEEANFSNKNTLIKSLEKIKKLKKGSYLCLNIDFYMDEQLVEIYDLLNDIKQYLTGVIVSDFILIKQLKSSYPGLKITASTRAKIFNSESVIFYSHLGVDTITLPICLTIQEIKNIILRNPDIGFDVFIKNETCKNINGLCGVTHNSFENKKRGLDVFCKYPRQCKLVIHKKNALNKKIIYQYYNNLHIDYSCGICKMKELSDIGIKEFKIAGRNVSLEKKIKDLYFVSEARKYINKNKINFQRKMKAKYNEIYGTSCHSFCLYKK